LRYLADFAWSFYILLSPLFDVLAGGIIALGLFLASALAILPHITREVK
jgi:hypothetical protein